jgi:hypothetical protein
MPMMDLDRKTASEPHPNCGLDRVDNHPPYEAPKPRLPGALAGLSWKHRQQECAGVAILLPSTHFKTDTTVQKMAQRSWSRFLDTVELDGPLSLHDTQSRLGVVP